VKLSAKTKTVVFWCHLHKSALSAVKLCKTTGM